MHGFRSFPLLFLDLLFFQEI
ncbi:MULTISPECIES: CRISPR-associated DxTHG motif protein [Bacillus]